LVFCSRDTIGVPYNRALRLGGVPCSRAWRDLENTPDIPVLSLSRRPFSGLARDSELLVASPGLLSKSHAVPSDRTPRTKDQPDISKLIKQFPSSEIACLRNFELEILPESLLFLGNSLPIREWRLATYSRPVQTYANRGANGIDGCLSTFLGLAYEYPAASWGIFGDLTTLYDLSAPSILSSMPNRAIRIIVINNGGGRIFRQLPNFQQLSASDEAVVENHHHFDYEAWAKSWGLDYTLYETGSFFPDPDKPLVIELRPDQAQSDAFWEAWNQRS